MCQIAIYIVNTIFLLLSPIWIIPSLLYEMCIVKESRDNFKDEFFWE